MRIAVVIRSNAQGRAKLTKVGAGRTTDDRETRKERQRRGGKKKKTTTNGVSSRCTFFQSGRNYAANSPTLRTATSTLCLWRSVR